MRKRPLRLLAPLLAALLVLGAGAPAAGASYGRGSYGIISDKVVTYAGFSLIAFFTLFPLVMSMLQNGLERRKEQRKAARHAGLGNGRWPGGW